ncbi:RimK/LysX family protein [Bacterioplanoides sp. SCSIO 12839]|uniref:ATP-dependent zinc protease family protein n=1 Tax=Bacterioplanoides sp. SCSIO 12839 TaxID=2829569 RepID=UPI002102A4D8|nr:RimK/LysX family protein [Bacterioplanoides sp. SCSIO 12839]UTW47701.1 ATP-dependent zinc protease [Bacterioplanoides sp. SCSIO 12839]
MEALVKDKLIIGALENCSLPDLSINKLQIRVDTGAQTSSLHVDDIIQEESDDKVGVSFSIHPDIYDVEKTIRCWAPIVDVRSIKSSNGESEERFVIRTRIVLGTVDKNIEVTLTDRSEMSYRMLFGRQGMGNDFLVDPAQTFLHP